MESSAGNGVPLVGILLPLLVLFFILYAMWRLYTKAGLPGWGVLVPIYNVYLLVKMAGRPGWWLLLLFIPFVNFIISLVISIDIAKNFGKGTGFGIGLWLLGVVFYPILAFSDAEYKGSIK